MSKRIKSIIECGIFAALISVMSVITVPLPSSVPLTLQTFAVSLCGYFLGVKKGLGAIMTYLAVGMIGLPVFSSFQGGLSVFFSPTGGFLIGFIPLTVLAGLGKGQNNIKGFLWGISGLTLCHVLGVLVFSFQSGQNAVNSFLISSAPFIIKDLIFLWIAMLLSKRLDKGIFYK